MAPRAFSKHGVLGMQFHAQLEAVRWLAIFADESYELSFLCDQFRIKTFDQIRHSALGDAIITARLFLFLLDTAKSRNNVQNIGGLINLCKQGRQIHSLMKNFNKIH